MHWGDVERVADRPRVLVLSRNYPNDTLPLLGIWAQRLTRCTASFADVKVVAPVPYAPPRLLERLAPRYGHYGQISARQWDGPVEVFHPRLVVGPGHSLYPVESAAHLAAVVPTALRLRRTFRYDVIHAHFTYPDGVVAALLGRLLRVPVVITEHTLWQPWIWEQPAVLAQARWAARACDAHVAVSEAVSRHIAEVTGDATHVCVVPNVVDGEVFAPAPGAQRSTSQILFVGVVRRSKGVDVLLAAMQRLRQSHPGVRLVLAGEPFYHSYRQEYERLLALAETLGVRDCIQVLGGQTPTEVARLMRSSAVVVLPSRRESFGTVLIEALASGTPVVGTRCGGPEEIITPEVGRLAPPEDPDALAAALAHVLDHPANYPADTLRRSALDRFGAPVVAHQLARVYAQVLGQEHIASHDVLGDMPGQTVSSASQVVHA